jgi:hypothetical protein
MRIAEALGGERQGRPLASSRSIRKRALRPDPTGRRGEEIDIAGAGVMLGM